MGAARVRSLSVAAALALAAVALAACSNSPASNSASSTSTTSGRGSGTVITVVTTTTTSSSTSTSGTLTPQTPTATEFVSPSANISCEIDSNFGTGAITQAMCLTVTPAKRAVLMTTGSVTQCTGQQCLSNAGLNTPTLQYGSSITLAPFTCVSASTGMTCTLSNGDGFTISSSAITPVGHSTVTPVSS